MMLTTTEIFDIVWNKIKSSQLIDEVPTIYADHYPDQLKGKAIKEFIVVTSLSNVTEGEQVATVNVNIYVPDQTPVVNKISQRYMNRPRLLELTKVAYEALRGYPRNERWFFDVSEETLMSEENIPYSFSNIKVKLKKY